MQSARGVLISWLLACSSTRIACGAKVARNQLMADDISVVISVISMTCNTLIKHVSFLFLCFFYLCYRVHFVFVQHYDCAIVQLFLKQQ